MANVVQLRTGGGPRRLQRAPAPKFVDCEPTRHASRIALAQNAINEARAAVPRATKALSNGWAKMPADAKTIFLRHFDPKGTGTIGEGFVENVLSNFRKVEAEIQGRVVIECEKEDGRMCKRTAKGTVLAYTYFLHVHLCPAFETEGDPTVTILHEIVHNALLALDRPYHDKPDEYGQLTPRGPAATRIPILGPIIRAGARKDTLYAPDAYAYFAKEVS